MSSERVLFVKRLGLLGLTNVVNALIGIILIPIFTKGRPLEDYGLWVQINVSLGLIPGLTCLGLPYTLVRYIAGEKDNNKIKEAVYSILFVIMVVNAVLAPLFAYLIIKYFGDSELELVPVFAILLFIQALSMVGWNYLRAIQKIKKYSLFMILQNLLTVFGVGYAIVNDYGVHGALLVLLAVRLLLFVVLSYEIISDLGIYMPKFIYMREFLRFGLPTIPGNFSAWIVSSSDRYLIGYYLGVKYVGYYNPAYSLGSLLNFIIGPLGFLLPAALSKLYEEGKIEEVKLYLEYLLKYYLIIAIPAVFGLSILAKPVLMILSTQEIAEKSYLVVPFVALGMLFWGLYTIFMQIRVLQKKTRILSKIWMFSSIINFVGNIFFIPHVGIIGAAITTSFAYLFAFAWAYLDSRQVIKVTLNFGIYRMLFSASLMAIIIKMALSHASLQLSILGLISVTGMIMYFIFIFLLGVVSIMETKKILYIFLKNNR